MPACNNVQGATVNLRAGSAWASRKAASVSANCIPTEDLTKHLTASVPSFVLGDYQTAASRGKMRHESKHGCGYSAQGGRLLTTTAGPWLLVGAGARHRGRSHSRHIRKEGFKEWSPPTPEGKAYDPPCQRICLRCAWNTDFKMSSLGSVRRCAQSTVAMTKECLARDFEHSGLTSSVGKGSSSYPIR
jgi:hypothetical protein